MATDDVNVAEDAEMAECDGDKVVTMMDVLQEQQDFEEDANAVLGASDDKNCTYSKGYIKRQALYACLTCCTEARTDPTKRAGVCLACSLNCHENHELIELYTKRTFRCDCGNPKFNSNPCQFTPDKTDLNDDNIYNQNFSGLYCTCHRPYPDPESTIEDDMIQCIICEDWLHASHLEAVVPANDQYSEMICKSCMEKNEFLHDYSMFAVTVETADVDIVTVNGDAKSTENSLCNGDLEKEKLANGIEENTTELEAGNATVNGDVDMSEEKVIEDADKETIEQRSTSETNEEIKQDDVNNDESESKPNDNEKPDNDDNNMALDTECKSAEQGEHSVETTETKDAEASSEETSAENENSETEKETINEQSNDKSDTPEGKPERSIDENVESTDEQIESTKTEDDLNMEDANKEPQKTNEAISDQTETQEQNDKQIVHDEITGSIDIKTDDKIKMDDTDKEPHETDEKINDQTETLDQNNKQSGIENGGDGDSVPKTLIKTQQLLDDLSALTADNSTTEEKPVESMEQSEDSVVNENVSTNNKESSEEITNESEISEQKPVSETVTDAVNIEVADTSQPDKNEEENPEDKTDAVMNAIDELLETTKEAKDNETEEQKKETEIISTESKVESVESKESNDVDMTPSETKSDNVPEKTEETAEPEDKISMSNDTDVEMSDTTAKNESASENKVDVEPASDFDNKDIKDTIKTDNTSNHDATVSEDKLDSESVTDKDEKSLTTDTAKENISQENVALNETDNEIKSTGENGITHKNEVCEDEAPNITENAKEHKRKLSTEVIDDGSSKKAKLECVRPKGVKRVHKGATFWPSNFRQKLCTCGECISMYNDLKVLFLTDLEDTVFAYESLGKENVAGGASQYEKGLQALSSLDRIQQINALTEYNKMRDKLLDFLKSFKDRKEIVKEEDIKAFFAGMKPRREPDGVYFCR